MMVRGATLEDIPWIIEELREFSRFYGTKHSLFGDEAYTQDKLAGAIGVRQIFVAEREGAGPVGFLGFFATPHIYNPAIRVACMSLWWVSPKHRFSGAGQALLDTFITLARESADMVILPIGVRCPVREESLERRGFHLQERTYVWEA